MSGNSIGTLFRLTSFGESHGPFMGGVIEGCPSGISLNLDSIQKEVDRRRPGQSKVTTSRSEADQVQFISGIFEGKTTGMPLTFIIANKDAKSKDYGRLKEVFRPSHADFTWQEKYGLRDYRGGGRSSARETVSRVVAGAVAKQVLTGLGIHFTTYTTSIGRVAMKAPNATSFTLDQIDSSIVRCPDPLASQQMEELILQLQKQGNSTGGVVCGRIDNLPVGLGAPVFDRLEADLAKAMLSINASKGFEIGSGFEGSTMKGSEHNDEWQIKNERMETKTNFSGGVQGGLSNGMPLTYRVAFKPVATIAQKQSSINQAGQSVVVEGKGRHDPCVVPRAVPVVEAMSAMVILDHVLLNKSIQL